jgi:hypothetical protein
VTCGVPFDVAFGLSEGERLGFIVAFGTLLGRRFNWQRLRWDEP